MGFATILLCLGPASRASRTSYDDARKLFPSPQPSILKGTADAEEFEVLTNAAVGEHEAQNEDNAPTVQDSVDSALDNTADDIHILDDNQHLSNGDGLRWGR